MHTLYIYVLHAVHIHTTQVVVDPPPQLADSEQNILKVGSRVWLKEKDLYGFVRYTYVRMYMYTYM